MPTTPRPPLGRAPAWTFMLQDRSFSELFSKGPFEAEPITGTRARRTNRRAQSRVPIDVEVTLATGAQFISGLSTDVSEGGVFVLTHRILAVGARVTIELTLPSGQVLARGIVRWVRDRDEAGAHGIGIAFEELSEIDRTRVAKFCGDCRELDDGDDPFAATS